MNIKPIPCANQEKGKVIKVKKRHRENRMRTLLLIAILVISTNFAFAECTEYLQAFNKHQLVMKGLMDLNFQGKMNSEVADTIGKRLQEAS